MTLLFILMSVVILKGTNSSIGAGLNAQKAEQMVVLNSIGIVLNVLTIIGCFVEIITIVIVFIPLICCKKHIDKIKLIKQMDFAISKELTFCNYCGMEVREGVTFCTNCGNQINGWKDGNV